jgi:hypothetical protein
MFNFKPNSRVPGFRVGLTDDEDDPVSPAFSAPSNAVPFGYDPYSDALQLTAPTRVGLAGLAYNPTVTPLGFVPQQPNAEPTISPAVGSPSPQVADQATPDTTALAKSQPGPDEPVNQADSSVDTLDPVQRTSGSDNFSLIGSARAQIPQGSERKPGVRIDPSPGTPVILPNGSTLPSTDSSTGQVMSPVPDLRPVAEAGQRVGLAYREMLRNPETAAGALPYLGTMLALNFGHAGTFDYQRRGNIITGYTQLPQFREVANINVGVFAQQAGLTLDEILEIAGKYAWAFSSNYHPEKPYGLDPNTARYITSGYRIGQTGVFGPAPPP